MRIPARKTISAALLIVARYAVGQPSAAPSGVLSQLTVNSFTGSGTVTIQAMTTDAAGNIYIAGTTSAPDLVVANAAQPRIGDGQIFRSLDRGATWQRLSDASVPGPLSVTPSPADPQILYATSPGGIYKTSDGGQTWRQTLVIPPASSSSTLPLLIAVDPGNPLLVYAYHDVYGQPAQFLASQDGGDSWQVASAGPPIGSAPLSSLWLDPLGSGTIGLGGWLSKDRGATWINMTRPPGARPAGAPTPDFQPDFTVPDPRTAGMIYATVSAGTTGQLFVSADWGSTWVQSVRPPAALLNLLPDPDLAGALYGVDAAGALISTLDISGNWLQPAGAKNLVNSNLASLSRVCHGGALLAANELSLDFGTTWQPNPLAGTSRNPVGLASGPGCALYAVQAVTSDAFVAKLAPGGEHVLWSTFLGGSSADSAAAIGLDSAGNVYVAGTTSSPDFPATVPSVGQPGAANGFLTQYDPNGNLQYSMVVGQADSVTSLAVTPAGDVFLAGVTSSTSFPITPGALPLQPSPYAAGTTGFAIRLDAAGGVIYSAGLPGLVPYEGTGVSVAWEANGSALFGGYSGTIYRMASDGSGLTAVSQQLGSISGMDTDVDGNVYVVSQDTQSSGLQSGSCLMSGLLGFQNPEDIIAAKLQPGGLAPVYSTRLSGRCASQPYSIRAGFGGTASIGLSSLGGFSLVNPIYIPTDSGSWSGAAAELGPDGTLWFSTDLPGAIGPAAAAPDGSIYAVAKTSVAGGSPAAIFRLPAAAGRSGGFTITGAFNAFDGTQSYPSPGTLITITGQNLSTSAIDLGLNDADQLPTQLGGVQVLFDGQAGEIMQVAPDHVICAIPWQLSQVDHVVVQVMSGSSVSNPLTLPIAQGWRSNGLLTQTFPVLPSGSADGNIRNEDGTLNGPDNPAAAGSMVTLFATGNYTPGTVYLPWNSPVRVTYGSPPNILPGTARSMGAGFIDAMYAIDFQIPQSSNPGVVTRNVFGTVGMGVGVYVK